MKKIINDLQSKNPTLYNHLKKLYEKTFGMWPLKKLYLKRIGFYNGRKRVKLLDISKSNRVIVDKIRSKEPFMLARYGSVEFKNLFSKKDFSTLCSNAGFFPKDIKLLGEFQRVYYEASKELNILAVWNYLNHFSSKKKLVKKLPNLDHLVPLCIAGGQKQPWFRELKNKKILVIHPYKKTIDAQNKKIKELGILPELKSIEVIKSVQTIAGNKDDRFKNWFEALNYMKQEINNRDFDIALIGCGAYGFPLAAHVKSIGKQAFHMGGGLQLVFGIKGKRWDKDPAVKYTKEWTSPLEEDIPPNYDTIEGGCYK